MLFFALFAGALALGFCFLGTRDQRELWWTLSAWRHADPKANEPSDTLLTARRVGWFVAAAVTAAGAIMLFNSAQQLSFSAGEVREAAQEAAQALDADDDGVLAGGPTYDSFQPYVEDAVRSSPTAEDNAVTLRVSRAAEDDAAVRHDNDEGDEIVENYVISNDGEDAVCLTVTGTNLGEQGNRYGTSSDSGLATYRYRLSASVSDGPCAT